MTTHKFKYEVLVEVTFTEPELAIIQACMRGHYDSTVRASVFQGGFFYGWLNRLKMGEGDRKLTCNSHELGLCAKAIEMPASGNEDEDEQGARSNLQLNFRNLLNSLGSEWERINDKIPEEVEYRQLLAIPDNKRTKEQTSRLRELATVIIDSFMARFAESRAIEDNPH